MRAVTDLGAFCPAGSSCTFDTEISYFCDYNYRNSTYLYLIELLLQKTKGKHSLTPIHEMQILTWIISAPPFTNVRALHVLTHFRVQSCCCILIAN